MAEPTPPASGAVGVRFNAFWRVFLWLPSVLMVGLAVIIPAATAGDPDTDLLGVLAVSALLVALGLGSGWLAWINRGVILVIDDEGVRRTVWPGRGVVRWSEVSEIRPAIRQVWLMTPNGYELGGRRRKRKYFIVALAHMANRRTIYAQLVRRWRAAHGASPG